MWQKEHIGGVQATRLDGNAVTAFREVDRMMNRLGGIPFNEADFITRMRKARDLAGQSDPSLTHSGWDRHATFVRR